MTRRTLWALLPAAGGLLLAAALAVAGAGERLYVRAAPGLVAGVLGVAVSAGWLLVARFHRTSHAREAARIAQVQVEAERSRRRFVQRLDHELKNPLTALLTALSGADGRIEERNRAVAHAQADRIRRLLTDLRRVADVETAELDREPVDLGRLLREAVDSAVADHGSTRTIRVDVPTAPWPLPTVTGDPDLLLVAIYNVVANALKYSGSDDVIEVRARESGGPEPGVVIEVADTGPGIADDDQAVVWEELGRGRGAAGVPGSGVGLALVRVIVHRHSGTVALRSRLGHGTSVYLQLPGTRSAGAP